jgi:hypothetical protein
MPTLPVIAATKLGSKSTQLEDYFMADDTEKNRQQGGQPENRPGQGQQNQQGGQQSGKSGAQPQKKGGESQNEDEENKNQQRRAS